MIINWFGQNCFKIQGEKSIVVLDPFDKNIGLKAPRLSADIVTTSNNDLNDVKAIKGLTNPQPFIVDAPGEYEVKDTFIYGIPSSKNNGDNKKPASIIYRIKMDSITLAHVGNLSHVLANGEVAKLEGIDILMIPVGGGDAIDAKQASEIISQLEPRIVIPMNYKIKGLKAKLDPLDKFCKEIGICPTDTITKFKIAKKDLPQEDLKVIVLQP